MAVIADLMDEDLLEEMVSGGYVSARPHDSEPYTIYNYSAKAQYEGVWNEVTRQCRGLIVHDDGTVIARPWPKFHNYAEHDVGSLDLDEPCLVLDKLDGSLGIYYPTSDGLGAIATRGSFSSDQALHATALFRSRYAGCAYLVDHTYLFEIIYPENRIVVNYHGLDDLVLLGGTITSTGEYVDPATMGWPGQRVPRFEAATLRDALALPPRDNAEGVVVLMHDTGLMLKIKQEDYVSLHKLVTGLSEKTVWEHAREGRLNELLERIPDEFHEWVLGVHAELQEKWTQICSQAEATFEEIVASLGSRETIERKEFALVAKTKDNAHLLFRLYDGREIVDDVWKMVTPSSPRSLLVMTEDAS